MILAGSCTKNNETTSNSDYTGWVAGEVSGGYGTILNTQNNGMAWYRQGSPQLAPNIGISDVYMVGELEVWAVGGVQNGYGLILHTSDGGINWSRVGTKTQIPNIELKAVHAIDVNTIWISGNNNTVLNSTDKGVTWRVFRLDTLKQVSFNSISSSGTNSLWITGEPVSKLDSNTMATIFHSSDGGTTWYAQGIQDSLTGSVHNIFSIDDANILAASDGYIYKSINGGTAWTRSMIVPGKRFNGVCAEDVNSLWAISDNDGIFHSLDGGLHWDTITPQLTGYNFKGIASKSGGKIWVVGAPSTGTGKGIILYTKNAGETWFIQSFPTDQGLNKVSFGKLQ